jgi:hypothetical protein
MLPVLSRIEKGRMIRLSLSDNGIGFNTNARKKRVCRI